MAVDNQTKPDNAEKQKHWVAKMASFVLRYAFVITMVMNTMAESLGGSVRGQFRYRYFHAQYADQLSQYNVSSGCGVEQVREVKAIENKITQMTERWRMYDTYIRVFPLIVGALLMGMKSDQIGRRFIFLFNTVITTMDYIIVAIVIKFQLHYAYTFIGLFLASVSGGEPIITFASYALISDSHGKETADHSADLNEKSEKLKEEDAKGARNGADKGVKEGEIQVTVKGDQVKAMANEASCDKNQADSETDNKKSTEKGSLRKPEASVDADDDAFDASRERSRSLKFVIVDIVRYLTIGTFQFATGYTIEYAGFFYALVIVVGLKIVIFVFTFLLVKETGKQKKSTEFLGPVKTILRTMKNPHKRATLILVSFGILFAFFSFVDEYGVLRTYQMSPPFCFNAIQLGWFHGLDYAKDVLLFPLWPIFRKFQLSEATIASFGMLTAGAATLLISLIRKSWVFFVATTIEAVGDLSLPMSRIIASRVIGRGALVSTLALMLSLQMIALFIATQASSYLYQFTVDSVPTAPFFMATAVFCLSAAFFGAEACRQHRLSKWQEDEETTTEKPRQQQEANVTRL